MKKNTSVLIVSAIALAGCKPTLTPQDDGKSNATKSTPAAIVGTPKTADGRSAKILQQAQVAPLLSQAPSDLRPSDVFVVDGNQTFDGWFLAADKIEFRPGATLTFSSQAMQQRRNFFIVTKQIVSDDPQKPGIITFASTQVGPANATAGQAATGVHAGGGGGAPGGPGVNGSVGNAGAAGFNAPNLTIVALDIPGSGPVVDLKGGVGGQGGQGQQGGDGGNGAVGVPASSSMFDCKHGAGSGGRGGDGGNGGTGGVGGVGGAGGTITVMAPGDKIPVMLQKLRIVTSGGTGGPGGLTGKGGIGGEGGQGGAKSLPYCRGDGSAGARGAPGAAGEGGGPGKPGVDGDLYVGSISESDFDRLYGGQ